MLTLSLGQWDGSQSVSIVDTINDRLSKTVVLAEVLFPQTDVSNK